MFNTKPVHRLRIQHRANTLHVTGGWLKAENYTEADYRQVKFRKRMWDDSAKPRVRRHLLIHLFFNFSNIASDNFYTFPKTNNCVHFTQIGQVCSGKNTEILSPFQQTQTPFIFRLSRMTCRTTFVFERTRGKIPHRASRVNCFHVALISWNEVELLWTKTEHLNVRKTFMKWVRFNIWKGCKWNVNWELYETSESYWLHS